jgi:hypothetical protein
MPRPFPQELIDGLGAREHKALGPSYRYVLLPAEDKMSVKLTVITWPAREFVSVIQLTPNMGIGLEIAPAYARDDAVKSKMKTFLRSYCREELDTEVNESMIQ